MIKSTAECGSIGNANDPALLLEKASKTKFTTKCIRFGDDIITRIKSTYGILVVQLISNNFEKKIKCFSLESKAPKEIQIVKNQNGKKYRTIDIYENYLLVNHENIIEVFDVNKCELIKTCFTESLENLSFFIHIRSCKNSFFASTDENIVAFDYSKNKDPVNKIAIKNNRIEFMKIEGNNLFLAYVAGNVFNNKYKVEIWNIENIENPKRIKKFSFKTLYKANRFFKINGNVLCSFEREMFTLINVKSGVRLKPASAVVHTFAKINGDRLFKGSCKIEVWNIANFKNAIKPVSAECFPLKSITLVGHKNPVNRIQVAGNFLVSTILLGTETRVWNIATAECLQKFDNQMCDLKLLSNRIIMHVLESEKEQIQIIDYNN